MAESTPNITKNKDEVLEIYPVLPLRNTVLFPQQIIPIYVGREQSLKLIADLPKGGKKYIVVVAQKDGSVENPKASDLYEYGTLAMVMKVFENIDYEYDVSLRIEAFVRESKKVFLQVLEQLNKDV